MYALGALVSPFVSTAIASSVQSRWHISYVFLVGLGTVNPVAILFSFRDTLRLHLSHDAQAQGNMTASDRNKDATRDMMDACRLGVVWLLSLFFFFSLGVGITSGGK
jgi:hypothetical protein